MRKMLLLIIIVVAALQYFQAEERREVSVQKDSPPEASVPVQYQQISSPKPVPRFSCDGRQYCSQMTTRAEAEYFVRHCPNVKMDGDRDGIPCENDTRF